MPTTVGVPFKEIAPEHHSVNGMFSHVRDILGGSDDKLPLLPFEGKSFFDALDSAMKSRECQKVKKGIPQCKFWEILRGIPRALISLSHILGAL